MISTALFNKPPFKNLIANGLVLSSDGQKMSKSKKNYPDPMEVRGGSRLAPGCLIVPRSSSKETTVCLLEIGVFVLLAVLFVFQFLNVKNYIGRLKRDVRKFAGFFSPFCHVKTLSKR